MFDGIFDKYTGTDYTIEIREDIKPYYARPFQISDTHESTFEREIDRLIKIGVLKK